MNERPRNRMCADDRRAQLLEVARRLFCEVGFLNTTTAMIAAHAQVTEPVLYRHFDSKLALFHDILEEIMRESAARFAAVAEHGANAAERLLSIVADFPQFSRERGQVFRLIDRAAAGNPDERTRMMLREYYGSFEALIERIIHEGREDGSIRVDLEPRWLSWMLIMTGIGLNLLSGLEVPSDIDESAPREMRDLVRALIRG